MDRIEKCSACGHEHKSSNYGTDFITLTCQVFVDEGYGRKSETSFVACPDCGTIKLSEKNVRWEDA